jgi:ADP-ribosyl-[dinitrogen reductase] hydrolase
MRVSPLAVFGAGFSLDQVVEWAEADAALTHPNIVCQQINALFAMAIATAIRKEVTPQELYEKMLVWAEERKVETAIIDVMKRAAIEPPADFMKQMGWVMIAFQNALYQMLHAESLEAGVVDTVMRGGDTDTNVVIAGALLGAIYGREAVPEQWQKAVLNCQPLSGREGVHCLRPRCFWPMDVLVLAEKMLTNNASETNNSARFK